MSEPVRQEAWRQHLADNARAVEERLSRLQEANRLLVHRWEAEEHKWGTFPQALHDELSENHRYFASDRSQAGMLHNAYMPLISTSLVANWTSEKTIRIYGLNDLGFAPAYLLDMQTPAPEAPRVIKAFSMVAITGGVNKNKDFALYRKTGIPSLDTIYDGHYYDGQWKNISKGEVDLRQSVFLTHMFINPELTGRQLDALATRFDKSAGPAFVHCDEVLAAVTPSHVAAIVLPAGKYDGAWHLGPHHYGLNAKLAGALAGFDHAQRGIALPVMLYDMESGRISYFAQGKQECRKAAFDVIHAIQQDGYLHRQKLTADPAFSAYRGHCQRLLGVDVTVPLSEQAVAVQRQGRSA